MKSETIYAHIVQKQSFSTQSHQGRGLNMNYAQQLIKEIDLLIENGNTSFLNLDDTDKDTLITLKIKSRKNNAYECITDANDTQEIVNAMGKFIFLRSTDSAIELAESMRDNAIQFYTSDLTELFNERLQIIESDTHYENGLKPIQDQSNGEITWKRA